MHVSARPATSVLPDFANVFLPIAREGRRLSHRMPSTTKDDNSTGRMPCVHISATATSLVAASLLCLVACRRMAQDFPNRPIKMLVGFPAGGPSDVPARIIGAKLQTALGQPVVVENKTGAAGMIALNDMLAQPRDGHTLASVLLYRSDQHASLQEGHLQARRPRAGVDGDEGLLRLRGSGDLARQYRSRTSSRTPSRSRASSITARSAPARSPRCCRSSLRRRPASR